MKTTTTVTKSRGPKAKKPPVPAELHKLEMIVGQFMEYWGFKKIHGRIWTHLYTSEKPLDSLELMARLKVSKGLMSLAIRDLLDYQVIKSDHVGRHGTTFYVANTDILAVISNVLRIRETQILSEARAAGEELLALSPTKMQAHQLSPERIQSVIDLTASAQIMLQAFLSQEPDGSLGTIFSSPLDSQFKS